VEEVKFLEAKARAFRVHHASSTEMRVKMNVAVPVLLALPLLYPSFTSCPLHCQFLRVDSTLEQTAAFGNISYSQTQLAAMDNSSGRVCKYLLLKQTSMDSEYSPSSCS
jgi:hypothetical protein